MAKIRYNADTPLYTSDARAWRIDQFNELWQLLQAGGKPVVLFVHGRGKEPNKSLRGGTFTQGMAVHKIERGYGVQVLMFNWDSAFNGFNFLDREVPLSHTDAGGAALGRVLAALAAAQAGAPAQPKPALLVHSMGSIVVQKALQQQHWPQASGLFSSVLFSQPDADDAGHADWLELLAKREQVFVTQNKDDNVLRRATDARPAGAQPLGLGTAQPLAPSARYIDISHMGALGQKDDDHEVFGKGAMNGQIHLCNFFTEALTGQPVRLDPADNVEQVTRQVVFRLKNRQQPGAPCLKVPSLPEL